MEYLELQSVIKNGSQITDVEMKKNRLHFRVDGHLFSSIGNFVYHERHPIFNHPVLDIQAKLHNTPEGIAEEEKRSEEIDKEIELFQKHKASLYKLILLRGLELMTKNGDEVGIKYIDYHFDIMENGNNCKKIIKILEDANH